MILPLNYVNNTFFNRYIEFIHHNMYMSTDTNYSYYSKADSTDNTSCTACDGDSGIND